MAKLQPTNDLILEALRSTGATILIVMLLLFLWELPTPGSMGQGYMIFCPLNTG